ncbi:MAG: DUF4230 domain-containing protein [Acidobacteriaceae bacterium]|nr:DUF4230 domain-containing protein [Acidobacteriaceae bacterium]
MLKFLAFFSTSCLICLLVAMAIIGRPFWRRTPDSPAIVSQVQRLSELVTVRYSIEKVVGMREEKSPVGEESILLLVRGRALAGIDLGALKPSDLTDLNDGSIRIRLPAPRIQTTYLDEEYTKVWDRSITWWTPWVTPDPDLEHKARMRALDEIRTEALEMGILAEAQRDAEADIRSLLNALGVKQVSFAYGD